MTLDEPQKQYSICTLQVEGLKHGEEEYYAWSSGNPSTGFSPAFLLVRGSLSPPLLGPASERLRKKCVREVEKEVVFVKDNRIRNWL